jgi:hypothetical protein
MEARITVVGVIHLVLHDVISIMVYLRNKSWKPECVGSFNMDWWILIFYSEPEALWRPF